MCKWLELSERLLPSEGPASQIFESFFVFLSLAFLLFFALCCLLETLVCRATE